MKPTIKKLYWILLIAIIVCLFFLVQQVRGIFNITAKIKDTPLVSNSAFDIIIKSDTPIWGNPGAALTIVEFADLGSSQSAKVHHTVSNFTKKHSKEIRLVWKNSPETKIFSDNNITMHLMASCLKDNIFWDFVTEAYDVGNPDKLYGHADKYGTDQMAWKLCADSAQATEKINNDIIEGENIYVKGPALFINNKRINIDEDFDLEQMLETLISTP